MKILLYGLNYAPEMTGIGKYTGELGAWLANRNHEVKAICAPPYYPDWQIAKGSMNAFKREEVDGVEVFRCPIYVPGKPSTLKRLVHLLSFVVSSFFALMFLVRWRPNVVLNVVPAIFTSYPAWLYCKVTGAKLVIHVQDFESDAMLSLGMADEGVIFRAWRALESFILSRAQQVTTISKAMVVNTVSKGVDGQNVKLFPNWSEVSHFQNVRGVEQFRASMKFSDQDKVALYSGNIGKKQGLELAIDAAHLAANKDSNIVFVICGEGAAKDELIKSVEARNLNNVQFFPLQSYADLPKLLAMADVHLVLQKPGVADAVLPSKLTNILAVGGNAVITTDADTEIGNLIRSFPGIAVAVEPESPESLLSGIEIACEQQKPNKIAVSYAKDFLAKEQVLIEFENNLAKLN